MKSPDEVMNAAEINEMFRKLAALPTEKLLNKTEQRVLAGYRSGLDTSGIAKAMGYQQESVQTVISRINKRFGFTHIKECSAFLERLEA